MKRILAATFFTITSQLLPASSASTASTTSTASTAVIPLPTSNTATTQAVPAALLPPLYQAIDEWAKESHRWEVSEKVEDVTLKPAIEKVKKLLADGADPNQPHAAYPSALCYAVDSFGSGKSFYLPCVLMLLNAGAQPSSDHCKKCLSNCDDWRVRCLLIESQHIASLKRPSFGDDLCQVSVAKKQEREQLLAQKKALLKITIVTTLGSASNAGAFANLSDIICGYVGPLWYFWRYKSPKDALQDHTLTTYIDIFGFTDGTKKYFLAEGKIPMYRKILTLADQE